MKSIRSHLLIWQITALILTGLLVSLITYFLAWNAFNRIRDNGLEQIAYTIVRHGVEYDNEDEDVQNDRGQFLSQIWSKDGRLLYSSLESGGPPPQQPGLHVVTWGDGEWRIYTLLEGGLTIQVGTTTANRIRRFAQISPWLLLPFSVLLAILGALIWTAVGRALLPLEQVRQEIGSRDIASLHALDTQSLPEEVSPLVETLNDLLGRLDQALTVQRQFVADAAHELRTPLTAVKLQAQLVRRSQGAAEQQAALDALDAGVERAAHLVAQLLQMARLGPDARERPLERVQLDDLSKQVVAVFSSQADLKSIDLGIAGSEPLAVMGQIDSLRVMLNNLVDNAVRYTPRGGRIDLTLTQEGDAAVITVADNGPGIPVQERDKVFERFYRLASGDIPGSGLGLGIVKEVVAAHHGAIELLDTPGGGLTVRVVLSQRLAA